MYTTRPTVPPKVALNRIKKGYARSCRKHSIAYTQTSQWYVGGTIDLYLTKRFGARKNVLLEEFMRKWVVDPSLDELILHDGRAPCVPPESGEGDVKPPRTEGDKPVANVRYKGPERTISNV